MAGCFTIGWHKSGGCMAGSVNNLFGEVPEPGSYAELHCLSNYSFLQAASYPEELVIQAARYGYRAIAITDECSVAGMVKAWQAAREFNIQLIVGSEFRSPEGTFVVLACNRQGYAQLCQLISTCRLRAEKGAYQFCTDDLFQNTLTDCLLLWQPASSSSAGNVLPVQGQVSAKQNSGARGLESNTTKNSLTRDTAAGLPLTSGSVTDSPVTDDLARSRLSRKLGAHFSQRLWLLYERSLQTSDAADYRVIKALSKQWKLPVVSSTGARMHAAERLALLHTLQAIKNKTQVQSLGLQAFANAERALQPVSDIQDKHPQAWVDETLNVARLCHFAPESLRYEYPAEVVPDGYTPMAYLREIAAQGLKRRYPTGAPEKVCAQLENELSLVEELDYAHFFLTIYDIVQFASEQNILHQGRGSAANSVLCYCLGITAVNPAQSDLLFERFISRERNEPPDIDVDFEHERREEVIQYIYNKYGQQRAALAATVITYRLRSALRDTGKALGFPEAQIEQLLMRLDRRDSEQGWQEQLLALGLSRHPKGPLLLEITEQILGFPRHLSQHVGGFVISAGPLSELVPVENAAMNDRVVIQWDKNDLEALCLLKVDVLALGMLTALRKSLALLPEFYRCNFQLPDIPQEDPRVYRMLQRADSIGVFQIESRAQMSMLPRLKPRTFYDLVIQIAIVRPGPIQGDMVHPYLRRRDGVEPVTYPSEEVKSVLERTLGVPIFQEQVIKLAMVAAGFTGGEADQLRRAMATWRSRGQLLVFRDKLLAGMKERGYTEAYAERIFEQICGFGEYGFPESHSASFANLAYASSWLKYHFPAAFYVGLLNSLPMGFYSASQLVQDAQRHQVEVRPVCINRSCWNHELIKTGAEPAIRLGLRIVKGLNHTVVQQLIQQRPAGGFQSMQDVKALQLSGTAMEALASADAFAAIAGNRYQSRWEMTQLGEQLPLLANAEQNNSYALPQPDQVDVMIEDYASTGLTLNTHPVRLLEQMGRLPRHRKAQDLRYLRHGQIVTVIGLVTGRQRPGSGKGVTFVTLEDDTGNVNVVLWQKTARDQRKEWLHSGLMQIRGILERQGEVVHVIAGRMRDLSEKLSLSGLRSRDFH